MSTEVTDEEIEKALLDVLRKFLELNHRGCLSFKELSISFPRNRKGNGEEQRRVLTGIHDLFLKGYLAWGHDFKNPTPPAIHITRRGIEMLERDI